MTDNLKALWDKAWEGSERRRWLYGRLGRVSDDGLTVVIQVAHRPNYVYVRMGANGDQGITIAKNGGVALRPGLPVRMRRDEGILTVYGTDQVLMGVDPNAPDNQFGVAYHTHPVAEVIVNRLGTPTADDLGDYINYTGSKGWVSGGAIVSSGGGTTVDVAAGVGFVRATNSETAQLLLFEWPAVAGLAIPANSTRYIKVEYNAGIPQVALDVTEDIDTTDEFLLGVASRDATIHISMIQERVPSGIHRTQHALREIFGIHRADRLGGLILAETGTRNITLTAGELYYGINQYEVAALDTSGAGTFDLYYRAATPGEWTLVADQTQWPNTQYDDGDGTLADLTAARYANIWFYLELDGDLVALYPQAQFTNVAAAEAESPPTSIPPRLQSTGILCARLTFQKSAAAAAVIVSAWVNSLGTGASPTTFLDLSDTPVSYSGAASYYVKVNAGADALEFVAGGGVVAGSGTINYVPLWTAADTLGDSVVQQASGNIGIGISPIRPLHVDVGALTANGIRLGRSGAANNPYFDIIMDTTGTPYVYLSAGDALAQRNISINPFSGTLIVGGTTALSGKVIVYDSVNTSLMYLIQETAATYTDASPNAQLNLRSRWTGQSVNWDTARIKWGFADTYSSSGARFGIDTLDAAGNWAKALTFIGGGYAFFHQSPISLTGSGEGTYNKSAIYNDTTYGFLIEVARETDASGGTPRPFSVGPRGGPNRLVISSAGTVQMIFDTTYGKLAFDRRNAWGGGATYFPTVFSSLHADEFVFLHNPHIPYLVNGTAAYGGTTYGSRLTFSDSAAASGNWQLGCLTSAYTSSNFSISRGGAHVPLEIAQSYIVIRGDEAADAELYLYADQGDDPADLWRIRGSTNGNMYFENYADSSWEAKMALTPGGISYFYDDVYAVSNVSAASFTDRTDFFDGDAMAELTKIKSEKGSKKLDHASLPKFAQAENGERNLGNMVSMLTVAVQQLNDRLAKMEAM